MYMVHIDCALPKAVIGMAVKTECWRRNNGLNRIPNKFYPDRRAQAACKRQSLQNMRRLQWEDG